MTTKADKYQKYVSGLPSEYKGLLDECDWVYQGDLSKLLNFLNKRRKITNLNWRLKQNTIGDIPRVEKMIEYQDKHHVKLTNYPRWVCE